MKKNKLFLGISFMLFCSSVFGQNNILNEKKWSLELMAGVNNSKFTEPNNEFELYHYKSLFRSVYSHFANASVGYKINKNLSLSVGVNFLSYGFNTEDVIWIMSNQQESHIKTRMKNQVFQTPIILKISPFERVPFYINVGSYMAMNYQNKFYDLTNHKEIETGLLLQTDYGVMLGAGYDWFHSKNFKLGNQINFYKGFSNLFNHQKVQGVSIGFKATFDL